MSKRGTLTLEELDKAYEQAIKYGTDNTIKWWRWLYLWAFPTYVIFDEGYVFKYKWVLGVMYVIGFEELPSRRDYK